MDVKANFSLKEPESSDQSLIYLKTYLKRRRLVYSTGMKIHPRHWHEGAQRPITYGLEKIKKELRHSVNTSLREEKNELENIIKEEKRLTPNFEISMKNIAGTLNKIETEFDNAIQYLNNHKKPINVDTIKTQLLKRLKPDYIDSSENISLWNRFDEFIEAKTPVYSPLTIKKYNTLKNRLKEFERRKKYIVSFDSINLEFYDKYKAYLLDLKNPRKEYKKGLLNDTISKEFSALKSFMQWSLERQYHTNTIFQSKQFSAKKKSKQDQVTLTEEEFESIYNMDLSKSPKLDRVRDLFCFGVFTGQRWSDIMGFQKEQLQGEFWVFYSQKTKDLVKVPMTGYSSRALKILEKYNYSLPSISQQKLNEYIKEVGKAAEVNIKLTIKRESGRKTMTISNPKYSFMSSHMARRTFVTRMLEKGVPITTIRMVTGHKDVETLMRYDNTSEEAVLEAFKSLS